MEQGTPVHSKQLTEAARRILRPMGLFQKGRSRIWLDDHCWWLGAVEFQPSSWSQGSYLNVGCMWLWRVKDYYSFDEGFRVRPFSSFRDEEEFELTAEQLAKKAAQEVNHYRSLFPNVGAVSSYYLSHRPDGFWENFNAAVACALAGRPEDAQRFFNHVTESSDDDRDWVLAAQSDAKHLSAAASHTERFRQAIAERVRRTRELHTLPPVSRVDFG
jgi:hypothetical protein